jgi:hypothetical protein
MWCRGKTLVKSVQEVSMQLRLRLNIAAAIMSFAFLAAIVFGMV